MPYATVLAADLMDSVVGVINDVLQMCRERERSYHRL